MEKSFYLKKKLYISCVNQKSINMYELRYIINKTNYEVVGRYPNRALAYGMRKKKALEPQYSLNKLKVVKI